MAPSDFWLFPKLKMPLKEIRFQDTDEINTYAMKRLMDIPKTDFEKQWMYRWEKCVNSQGAFFKGDKFLN